MKGKHEGYLTPKETKCIVSNLRKGGLIIFFLSGRCVFLRFLIPVVLTLQLTLKSLQLTSPLFPFQIFQIRQYHRR